MNNSLHRAAVRAQAAHGWSDEHTALAAQEYERFVALAAAAPGASLVPCADIDLVWHEHLAERGASADPAGPVPAHGVGSTQRQDARFAMTRSMYEDRWGPPCSVWDVAAKCHVDSPPEDEGAPSEPSVPDN